LFRGSSCWPHAIEYDAGVRALVPTRFAKTAAKRLPTMQRLMTAVPRAWHLLSLDAPTVAATWCTAFLVAVGVSWQSQALRWPVLFLSIATWLCYVGDRVLDARSPTPANTLRARHHFYGTVWREQRSAFVLLVGLATLACAVIARYGLRASLLASFAALSAVSLLYFRRVHTGFASRSTPLAKEAAVAVIFALGCLIPAWTDAPPEARPRLALTGAVFGLLCWLNCVAIERWESGGSLSAGAHPTTRWAAERLAPLLVLGSALAGALGLLRRAPANANLEMLAPCLAGAFMLLAVLEGLRLRLSSEALRILADAALLTPLVWWAARSMAR
jgi:hypothetical protein